MVRGASLHCNHRILVHRKLSFEEYLPARPPLRYRHTVRSQPRTRATAWPPLITMHDFSAALISTAASPSCQRSARSLSCRLSVSGEATLRPDWAGQSPSSAQAQRRSWISSAVTRLAVNRMPSQQDFLQIEGRQDSLWRRLKYCTVLYSSQVARGPLVFRAYLGVSAPVRCCAFSLTPDFSPTPNLWTWEEMGVPATVSSPVTGSALSVGLPGNRGW